MAGRMLTPQQMQEVKIIEAELNGRRKREGTRHPIIHIIWGCGCCQGPHEVRHRTILTAEEGEKYLKFRKAVRNLERRYKDRVSIRRFNELFIELERRFGMSASVQTQQWNHNVI